MEALSLLKNWRGNGAGELEIKARDAGINKLATTVTTTTTAFTDATPEQNPSEEDDGPFFDLKLAVPDDDNVDDDRDDSVESSESDDDGDEEVKIALSTTGSISDGSFETELNVKPQFHESVFKSATKLRVFMLGLKKSKSTGTEKTESPKSATDCAFPKKETPEREAKQTKSQQESKFFTVKFRVEDMPIVSLLNRDSSKGASNNKSQKQNVEETDSTSEENRFSKEVMQKYLMKKVKPLYIHVSKHSGVKLSYAGQSGINSRTKSTKVGTESEAHANNAKSLKHGSLPAGLKTVRKHLTKSISAPSTVSADATTASVASKRDDSLLQQQDGIQSAILHCKRSFNSSTEKSVLSRSSSDYKSSTK